jgi:hypothetical protein
MNTYHSAVGNSMNTCISLENSLSTTPTRKTPWILTELETVTLRSLGRHRHSAKKMAPFALNGPSTKNSFEALQKVSEDNLNPITSLLKSTPSLEPKGKSTNIPHQNQIPMLNPLDTTLPASLGKEIGDPDMDLEDQDLEGIDLVHLEQAYWKK